MREDLDALTQFIVRYHSDYNYDATEDWEYSWTFSKALLFTVTIMTTIGKNFIEKLFEGSLIYHSSLNFFTEFLI